jgi:hypothetical protein
METQGVPENHFACTISIPQLKLRVSYPRSFPNLLAGATLIAAAIRPPRTYGREVLTVAILFLNILEA